MSAASCLAVVDILGICIILFRKVELIGNQGQAFPRIDGSIKAGVRVHFDLPRILA